METRSVTVTFRETLGEGVVHRCSFPRRRTMNEMLPLGIQREHLHGRVEVACPAQGGLTSK